MEVSRNFIITVIVIILGLTISILYILMRVEPNIYWIIGFTILVGVTVAFIFSIIFFAFAKLRSFETPKGMYRRQLRKGAIVGFLVVALLLAQKFFDLL